MAQVAWCCELLPAVGLSKSAELNTDTLSGFGAQMGGVLSGCLPSQPEREEGEEESEYETDDEGPMVRDSTCAQQNRNQRAAAFVMSELA